jgi:16S rRNA processing protein RimM
VFEKGRSVWVMNLEGEVLAGPLEIERSRGYHREWLMSFRGHTTREAIEPWCGHFLSAPADTLTPPAEGEVYVDELAGFVVETPTGDSLGIVTSVLELPAGLMLEVQGPKREFLLPFRKEFVKTVDRARRRLEVELPEGLAE